MKPEYFLGQGKFTKRNEEIWNIIRSIRKSNYSEVDGIQNYVRNMSSRKFNEKEFRKRTAAQIIESGYVTGCTDTALCFVTLARAMRIPTKYIETFEKNWLENKEGRTEGHIFTSLYFDKQWFLYEPLNGFKGREGYSHAGNEYVPFAEGLDFSKLYTIKENKKIKIYSIKDMIKVTNKPRKLSEFLNPFHT